MNNKFNIDISIEEIFVIIKKDNIFFKYHYYDFFQSIENDPLRHGPLAVIASILKHSAREDVKPYSQMLLDNILKLQISDNPTDLIRKFGTKIVQRIGMKKSLNFVYMIYIYY